MTVNDSPMDIYKRYFPKHELSCYQQDLIEGTVKDLGAWERTLEFWAGNDYRPRSVFKMLAYYHETLRNRSSAQVGKDTSTPKTYACSECFDTGTVRIPDPDSPYSWAAKDAPCPKCSGGNNEI